MSNTDQQHDGANPANNEQSEAELSPGSTLLAAREKLGLTQKQVAERLHLRLSSIQALETDALEPGVSVTFTKGYIRLYAKLVQLNAEPLLEAFNKAHTVNQQPAKLQSFSRRVTREANDYRWNLVTIVVVLLVLGSVIVWWVDREGYFAEGRGNTVPETTQTADVEANASQNDPLSEQSQNVPETADSSTLQTSNPEVTEQEFSPQVTQDELEQLGVDAQGAFELSEDELDAIDTQSDENTNNPSSANTNIGATSQEILDDITAQGEATVSEISDNESRNISESLATSTNNSDGALEANLVFTFADDCWVSVKDKFGEVMAIGVKKRGRVMEVSGLPPIDIILGAPGEVSITYNGEAVDMSIFPSSRSANFTLPLETE